MSETRICETCGKQYSRPGYQRPHRFARRRYCSKKCESGRAVPVEERYWKYVIPEPNSGCWLWIGATTQRGYGHILRGRQGGYVLAHRLSYEMHKGPIPEGMMVLHKCDNPFCSNPDHLYIGSAQQNTIDMQTRGLGGRKLTPQDAIEIRSSDARTKDLAAKFGVGELIIQRIRSGKSWRHV